MDWSSQPDPELTTLETVGNQWHYARVVVQAKHNARYIDCIWPTQYRLYSNGFYRSEDPTNSIKVLHDTANS